MILEQGQQPLPLIAVRNAGRGTEVFVYDDDKDYLFAATTTLLERLGLTVLDARIFTNRSGRTFDSYIVIEANGDPISARGREGEIRRTLTRGLKTPAKSAYPASRVPRRQIRAFDVAPSVAFSRDPKAERTIMEVTSADRPGLLSRVGWALVACGVQVLNAKISTLGERAEDIFFLVDRSGGPLTDEAYRAVEAHILRALEPAKPRQLQSATIVPVTDSPRPEDDRSACDAAFGSFPTLLRPFSCPGPRIRGNASGREREGHHSAPGHRREKGHLVAIRQDLVGFDIVVVDGDEHAFFE